MLALWNLPPSALHVCRVPPEVFAGRVGKGTEGHKGEGMGAEAKAQKRPETSGFIL